MQLNKVLKGLMLALPVLAIAACSSHKSADNDQSGMGWAPALVLNQRSRTCLQKSKLVCRCNNCKKQHRILRSGQV